MSVINYVRSVFKHKCEPMRVTITMTDVDGEAITYQCKHCGITMPKPTNKKGGK